MDDQRDYDEEQYWRNYCPECDGTCTSTDNHAELGDDRPYAETIHVAVIPKCDLCITSVGKELALDAEYDGKTNRGPWAYMCPGHFLMHGMGLGLGRGQKLILETPA